SLFPYTTLFRSDLDEAGAGRRLGRHGRGEARDVGALLVLAEDLADVAGDDRRAAGALRRADLGGEAREGQVRRRPVPQDLADVASDERGASGALRRRHARGEARDVRRLVRRAEDFGYRSGDEEGHAGSVALGELV